MSGKLGFEPRSVTKAQLLSTAEVKESQGEGKVFSMPPIQDQELFHFIWTMLGLEVSPFPVHLLLYDKSLSLYMEVIWSCLRNVDLF